MDELEKLKKREKELKKQMEIKKMREKVKKLEKQVNPPLYDKARDFLHETDDLMSDVIGIPKKKPKGSQ